MTKEMLRVIEELADACEMLENVFYWDTCPQEYKERIIKICKNPELLIGEE